MEFLSEHVIPPTGHYLDLLQVLAVIIYLIHLPYVGIAMGSTILSMWLTFRDREIPDANFSRFAGELVETFLGNKYAMLVLGIFPLLTLPFIYAQWFAGLDATPVHYIPMAIPGVALGMVLLFLYRASYPARATNFATHMLFGTGGVLVLLGSYFLLMCATGRLHDPEKWFRVTNVLIMVLNWNVIWKFLFFVHAAFAITGGAVLFFFFRWPRKGQAAADDDYASFVRKFAGGIAIAFTFSLPVWYLFYIFTTPDVAFDKGVYVLAAALVLVAMITAFVLLSVLSSPRPRWGTTTFTLFLVIFALMNIVDQRAMVNANQEHAALLSIEHEKEKAEREAEIEAAMAQQSGKDVGKETFESVCMQCHRFDSKLVGPPLNTVLPNYAANPEALRQFLANPTKRNPDYPPMPNPGLTKAQINAVAEYVLSQLDQESGGGTGGE
jgi:mono/diheme cytochrome c family protein